MATRNDITGDLIASKGNSKSFTDNFDAIFRKAPAVYGCHNRDDFKKMVEWKGKPFEFTGSMNCNYDAAGRDDKCVACKHIIS